MQDYSGYGQPPSGYGGGYGSPTSPMPPTPPPRPPRRRVGLLSYVAVALVAALLGAGTVVGLYHPTSSSSPAVAAPSTSAPAPAPSSSALAPAPSSGSSNENAVVSKVEPGLVLIATVLQYNSEQAWGTGMVINSDGLVLTNNHVIEDSTKIQATVADTGKTYIAKVVGYDTTGDMALIQLEGASGLHTIPVGNSSTVKTGADVVAMGNAEGEGRIAPVTGQVTGLNQTITASDEGGTITTETLHGMIETNASIVQGDSGGPLADSAGQVIGMDTAGDDVSYPQQQSTAGFAIPITRALAVAKQIEAGKTTSTVDIGYPPFIGIYIGEGSSSSPQAQAQAEEGSSGSSGIGSGGSGSGSGSGGFGNGFGSGNGGSSGTSGGSQSCYTSDADLAVPSTIASVSSGTLVVGTICDSPAESAGITAGSVITAVNGKTIGSPQTLTSTVGKYHPGDTIDVTWVSPSGQRTTSKITLTAGPPL